VNYFSIILATSYTKEELELMFLNSPDIPGTLISIQSIKFEPGVMSTGVGE
jgi:hypothetical protein